MAANQVTKSAAIHARLSHPVIDSDGHWIEYEPAVREYVRKFVGEQSAARYERITKVRLGATGTTLEQRQKSKLPQHAWWPFPTRNTLDRATAMLPKLLYERLPDMGLDYCVLFPTSIMTMVPFMRDEELRRGGSRALNTYAAELFRDYADRMTPVAGIPIHTPQEAIEELEHVKSLGLKVVMLAGLVNRHVPGEAGRSTIWRDPLGLDSDYDYDPVWAKCLELGLIPTFHNSTQGLGFRASTSNWVYNHIGHFATAGDTICKALFLGGVTRRFPKLKFAFLEGGAGWACSLYSDLIRHWKTRNINVLDLVDPANLDENLFRSLAQRYGDSLIAETVKHNPILRDDLKPPPQLDDFWRCDIKRAEDIRDLFVPNFFFGCEAEDPMNAVAFNDRVNPFRVRLNAILGSDIGHFDVKDMNEVLEESWELVEHGVLNEEQLREMTFTNPVKLFAGMNPDFFKATAVEKPAAALLSSIN
jgi:predicted TIM-barrel fold metal-dependent hydrolase